MNNVISMAEHRRKLPRAEDLMDRNLTNRKVNEELAKYVREEYKRLAMPPLDRNDPDYHQQRRWRIIDVRKQIRDNFRLENGLHAMVPDAQWDMAIGNIIT